MNHLKEFSRNSKAYDKQTSKEVGFVDGLFEMYKLRELIALTKAKIISEGVTSMYKHKFGTNLFTSNIKRKSKDLF